MLMLAKGSISLYASTINEVSQMSTPEALGPQQQADTMMSVLNERLAAASPVEDLSMHDNRRLQVFEEADGRRFVMRSFTAGAVREMDRDGISIQESWDAMHGMYEDAGLQVVPAHLFEQDGEYPFVAVAEHLPELTDVKDLPVEDKITMISGLGKLLSPEAEYWPSLQAIRTDTFKGVQQPDGSFQTYMIDTDPFVIPAPQLGRSEFLRTYINKFAELLWDEWCDEEDRGPVATALVKTLAETLDEEEWANPMDDAAGSAFASLHLMSNGVDPRETGLFA